jgi:hypothetical protein
MSEFQAGWLAPPEDPAPRPADPSNTTLALHTLLGLGMRGVIDFPAQDTVSPAGWEAPFANASYAWDAALDVNLVPSPRYPPTKRFGDILRAHGDELADARRSADGAIAYLTSAYDETQLTNADVFAILARTQQTQQTCRARHLTCDLVDLRFADDRALRRYPFLIVPRNVIGRPLTELARSRLARYQAAGGHVVPDVPDVVTPRMGGIADATLLLAHDGAAFIDIVNFDSLPHPVPLTRIRLPRGKIWTIGPLSVAPRDAVLLYRAPSGATGNSGVTAAAAPAGADVVPDASASPARGAQTPVLPTPLASARPCQPAQMLDVSPSATPLDGPSPLAAPQLIEDDRAADGYPRLTLANAAIAVTLAPSAGARAFTFRTPDGPCGGTNVFTSVGALRDDVAIQPPLSTTDRIGKYTRSFPAGFFNRTYAIERRTTTADSVSATLAYDAPDVVPSGAHFERTISLRSNEPAFTVTQRVTFGAGAGAARQRAVRYDSFDARDTTVIDDRSEGAVGWYSAVTQRVAVVAWPLADIETAALMPEQTSTVLRLQFSSTSESRTRYALDPAADINAARRMLAKERAAVQR